jgi:hypothetical protein
MPSFLENFANTANKALGDLAGVAVKNLNRDGSDSIRPASTNAVPSPVTAPAGVATSVPFYKQSWFAPAAIGAGILLVLLFALRR